MDGPSTSDVLGTGRSFDHYARLVRRLLRVPVALVSIVEADHQTFPGMAGLSEPVLSARKTPLSHSFCKYVVADEQPLVINDARRDPRLASNPAIVDLGVIAYVGWPLVDERGRTVGSLCAIDTTPREWSTEEVDILQDLALACSAELQARLRQAQESENLARVIFESANVAMVFYDVDDQLVMANSLAERAVEAAGFTLERPPYAGVNVRRADNLEQIPFDEQIIPRALRGDLHNHEMEWIGPPGSQIAIVASSQQVRRTDGTLRGTLVAAHDVTELARSLHVKDEFIATVSHELRTPLASILGYLEILREELDPEDGFVAATLATIQRNADRLHERVQQLLNTADRRRHLSLASCDLTALTQRVVDTFGEEVRAAQVELTLDSQVAQWAAIDSGQIEQALENLVSNAIKYTGAGGQISLTVVGREEDIQVAVSDTGTGMTPDEIAQACDPFWRSEGALQGAIQGFGLGLTLVRDIVAAHHGSTDFVSEQGQGTTVTLTFPRDALRARALTTTPSH